MRIQVPYYKLAISYYRYLFLQLEAEIMEDQRRNLNMKHSDLPGGPPA
jgi:hypothetical protein